MSQEEKPLAVVSGASSGIGLSLIKQLAARGYRTVGVARRRDRLQQLSRSLGAGHSYLSLDLTRRAALAELCAYLRQHRVSLLVNNAGFGSYGEFAASPCTDMLNLNVEALATLCHTFLQEARAGDALLNVASALAFVPAPYAAAYAASKAFVASLSDALWYEYRAKDIYVLCLCPAATVSEFHHRAGRKSKSSAGMQSADEVARLALQALHQRRQASVLTSSRGKLLYALARLLPRRLLVQMMGKVMRRWIT